MLCFWRGFLWTLAVALVIGAAVSWLEGGTAWAQDEDEEVEINDVAETSIQDNPHLYWKCWRTASHMGGGFTNAGIVGAGLFATPYLPVLDGFVNEEQQSLTHIRKTFRWKKTRADLIDARFYRGTGLVYFDAGGVPQSYRPDQMLEFDKDAKDDILGGVVVADPSSDDLDLPSDLDADSVEEAGKTMPWNPFLAKDGKGVIKALNVEWDTGSGRSGANLLDPATQLEQQQIIGATVAGRTVTRDGPYRGDADTIQGQLDPHGDVYYDANLGNRNVAGYRTRPSTETGQVMTISGTVSTSGTGGNVTTVVNLESEPQEVTVQGQSIEYNDPLHQEIEFGGVARIEDKPALHIVHTSGWHSDVDDSEGGNPIGFFWIDANRVSMPSNTQPAATNGDCLYLGSKAMMAQAPGSRTEPESRRREHLMLCWLVHSDSEFTGEYQTFEVSGRDLNSAVFDRWKMFGDGILAPDHPLETDTKVSFTMGVWVRKGLDESERDLQELQGSGRRGLLAPEELQDAPDDAIVVSIDLDPEHRSDVESSRNFTEKRSTRWHLFAHERLGKRSAEVHVDGAGMMEVGVKQSYMLPPTWGVSGNDRIVPWMYDDTDPLIRDFSRESLVVWPAYLADMNYYLFHVRDFSKEHVKNRGHVLNLAHAGYSKGGTASRELFLDAAQYGPAAMLGAYIYGIVQKHHGRMGSAVAVPEEVKGTSGRTNLLFNSLHMNPFTDGKLYYPFFDVNAHEEMVEGDYARYPRRGVHDYDAYLLNPVDLVKAGVVGPSDAGNSDGGMGANSMFRWRLNEGEPVIMSDGDGARDVTLQRLGFNLSHLSYLESMGLPSDPFEERNLGTETNPVLGSAWPNGYIDPNDAHLLVLTFYEGRLAREWRFMPRGLAGNALAQSGAGQFILAGVERGESVTDGFAANLVAPVAGAAHEGLKHAGNFIGFNFDTDETVQDDIIAAIERDLMDDLGAVPTFQYRRVICRVVVPPDGVVTQATGWTAVTDGLKGLGKKILDGLMNAVTGLIAKIQEMPEKAIMGAATLGTEGVCHGAGLMDGVGRGSTDVPESKSGAADVVIEGPEMESHRGRENCERVRKEGAVQQPGGGCDEVAAAVHDHSCSPVPIVNFKVSSSTGRSYGSYWERVRLAQIAAGLEYRDVYYYSYPGTPAPSGWQPYRSGLSLVDAVTADWGYGWAWFELPQNHRSLSSEEPSLSEERVRGYVNQGAITGDNALYSNLAEAMAMVSGADYDGFVLYVKGDSRFFRYVDCQGITENVEDFKSWDPDEKKCVQGMEADVDGDGDTEVIPWKVPVYYDKSKKAALPVGVAPVEDDVYRFMLPRYYVRYQEGLTDRVYINSVPGFTFGSVTRQRSQGGSCRTQVPVLHKGGYYYGQPDTDYSGQEFPEWWQEVEVADPPSGRKYSCNPSGRFNLWQDNVSFVGASDWDKLAAHLDYLWYLGADSEYSLALAAYRGNPNSSVGYDEGDISDWVTLRGGAHIACLQPEVYWHTKGALTEDLLVKEDVVGDFLKESSDPSDRNDPLDHYVEYFDCERELSQGELQEYGPGSDYDKWTETQFTRVTEDSDDRLRPRLRSVAERGVLAAQATPLLSGDTSTGYIFGASQCGGFWSGTPDGFSWDSEVVWTLWSIAFVFAMVLLFVLLLWDGIGLIYAGWLGEGRSGVTVGSLLPRYLLAVVLMLLSLFITRVTLSLAGDVTCFFIHATGMTFWGFIWGIMVETFFMVVKLFGTLLGFSAMIVVGVGIATGGVGALFAAPFIKGFFIVICGIMLGIFLFVLYYAVKVFAGMLVRIVLLVLLIGLAPVAFAMYASESTAHWTKKWVSLFLGTVFQQLVVLFVLFGGASLAADFHSNAEWWNLWEVFLSLMMLLMVVFLAARIPDIVNPGAKGMFSGFGQALMIAAAAGTALAGGVAGAVGGAASGAGLMQGGMSSTMGRMGEGLRHRFGMGGRFGGGGGGGSMPGGQGPSGTDGGGGAGGEAGGGGVGGGSGATGTGGSGGAGGVSTVSGVGPGSTGAGGSGLPSWGQMSGRERLGGALFGAGRGFLAGMSRSSNAARALSDMSTGRIWTQDPTVSYANTSRAQLQSFENYARGVGNDDAYAEAAMRAQANRGYVGRGGVPSAERGRDMPDPGSGPEAETLDHD